MGSYLPRYVSAFTPTVGSATLPQGSLYAIAGVGFSLVEAYFFGGSGAAQKAQLNRLASAGTPGATQGVAEYDDDSAVAQCTPFTTHTVAPTLGEAMHPVRHGGITGAGVLLGFHDAPIEVAPGTANGIGWLPTTASGDADVAFVWDEA